jgi:3' terminal RNA ribose 2'-O-methyltransferase Hen1
MPDLQRKRIELLQGSLVYRDDRLAGFDAAAVVEVIEHMDADRLPAFEAAVFAHARPRTVVITTPNREYNVLFESLGSDKLRHPDHRFEWTRTEFEGWAKQLAERNGYSVEFDGIGPAHAEHGSPTQMGVFTQC